MDLVIVLCDSWLWNLSKERKKFLQGHNSLDGEVCNRLVFFFLYCEWPYTLRSKSINTYGGSRWPCVWDVATCWWRLTGNRKAASMVLIRHQNSYKKTSGRIYHFRKKKSFKCFNLLLKSWHCRLSSQIILMSADKKEKKTKNCRWVKILKFHCLNWDKHFNFTLFFVWTGSGCTLYSFK